MQDRNVKRKEEGSYLFWPKCPFGLSIFNALKNPHRSQHINIERVFYKSYTKVLGNVNFHNSLSLQGLIFVILIMLPAALVISKKKKKKDKMTGKVGKTLQKLR